MRCLVTALDCTFIRNGWARCAISSIDSSVPELRMMNGCGWVYGRGRSIGSLRFQYLPWCSTGPPDQAFSMIASASSKRSCACSAGMS